MKRLKTNGSPKTARRALRRSGPKTFDVDRLLKHIDPGTPEEAEEFVRGIYDLRRQDREHQVPR